MKTVAYTVQDGEIEVVTENNTHKVLYHNKIYVRSPFRLAEFRADQFSISEVLESREVQSALVRF